MYAIHVLFYYVYGTRVPFLKLMLCMQALFDVHCAYLLYSISINARLSRAVHFDALEAAYLSHYTFILSQLIFILFSDVTVFH